MNKQGLRDGISNTASAVSDLTVDAYSDFKESMAQSRVAAEEAQGAAGNGGKHSSNRFD